MSTNTINAEVGYFEASELPNGENAILFGFQPPLDEDLISAVREATVLDNFNLQATPTGDSTESVLHITGPRFSAEKSAFRTLGAAAQAIEARGYKVRVNKRMQTVGGKNEVTGRDNNTSLFYGSHTSLLTSVSDAMRHRGSRLIGESRVSRTGRRSLVAVGASLAQLAFRD